MGFCLASGGAILEVQFCHMSRMRWHLNHLLANAGKRSKAAASFGFSMMCRLGSGGAILEGHLPYVENEVHARRGSVLIASAILSNLSARMLSGEQEKGE